MGFVFLGSVLLCVLAFAGWVRMAPSDPQRWHRPVPADHDVDRPGGVIRVTSGDLAALDAIVRREPRTEVLAGSVAEGRVTYVTRSKFWGFPDYATLERRGEGVAIWSRLRFGRSDMGVNGKRVARWLAALAGATGGPEGGPADGPDSGADSGPDNGAGA